MPKIVRIIIVALSVVVLIFSAILFWKQYRPNKFKFEDFKADTNSEVLPSYLAYGDVALPLYTDKIVDGKWPTSEEGLTYLSGSGQIGSDGNAVIYGHNWPNLLGFLKNVRVGEKLLVKTSNNVSYFYAVETIQEVTSDQTHILSDSNDSRLTLYTCSGFLDTKRLVVVAKLVP